jgi:hypothetical protein
VPVIHCRQSCRQRQDDGDPICTQANLLWKYHLETSSLSGFCLFIFRAGYSFRRRSSGRTSRAAVERTEVRLRRPGQEVARFPGPAIVARRRGFLTINRCRSDPSGSRCAASYKSASNSDGSFVGSTLSPHRYERISVLGGRDKPNRHQNSELVQPPNRLSVRAFRRCRLGRVKQPGCSRGDQTATCFGRPAIWGWRVWFRIIAIDRIVVAGATTDCRHVVKPFLRGHPTMRSSCSGFSQFAVRRCPRR